MEPSAEEELAGGETEEQDFAGSDAAHGEDEQEEEPGEPSNALREVPAGCVQHDGCDADAIYSIGRRRTVSGRD